MLQYLSKYEWFKNSLDFIFPPLCLGCGEYTENKYDVCKDCLERIEPFKHAYCLNCSDIIPNGIECIACRDESFPLIAFSQYATPLKDIIIQFKFKGITKTAALFAGKLSINSSDLIHSIKADELVPIPLHSMRENVRGYNQATIFAGELGRVFEINVNCDILFRKKRRLPQARLNPDKRTENIKDVFEVIEVSGNNKSVIIVDDVVTSGSTVREAKRTLTEANYNVRAVIAVAQTL
ncbi:ComF family protein [Candidatus Zixiibacteriota bacterium]